MNACVSPLCSHLYEYIYLVQYLPGKSSRNACPVVFYKYQKYLYILCTRDTHGE